MVWIIEEGMLKEPSVIFMIIASVSLVVTNIVMFIKRKDRFYGTLVIGGIIQFMMGMYVFLGWRFIW